MRKILIVAVFAAFAIWYLKRRPAEPVTVTGTSAAPSPGPGCLLESENANRLLADTSRLLASMPASESAFHDAENRTTQAIARAEAACTGGSTDAERAGLQDALEALSLIRTTLSEASGAARGGGGFQGAIRQEQIDSRLSSARSKFGLR
jgi:hypothetical protein